MLRYEAGIRWRCKLIYDFPFKRTTFERLLNDFLQISDGFSNP